MQHYHDRGTMNITGEFIPWGYYNSVIPTTGAGAFYDKDKTTHSYSTSDNVSGVTVGFDASRSWTGKTSGSLVNQTSGNTTAKTNTDSSGSTETKPINVSTKLWKRVS